MKWLIGTAVALVLAGCGGGSDTSTPEGTVNAFVDAYSARDYAAACDLLGEPNDITDEAAWIQLDHLDGPTSIGASCEDDAELVYDEKDLSGKLESFNDATPSDVGEPDKDGYVEVDTAAGNWTLEKNGDQWEILFIPWIGTF